MTHTEDDYKFLPKINKSMSSFSNSLQKLASYVANCNVKTKIDLPLFRKRTSSMAKEIKNLNILNISNKRSEIFLKESFKFISLTKKGDLNKLRNFVKKTKYLFKDAVGNDIQITLPIKLNNYFIMQSKINSHNEWDKLKEVIVGSARQATIAAEYFNSDKIPEEIQKN